MAAGREMESMISSLFLKIRKNSINPREGRHSGFFNLDNRVNIHQESSSPRGEKIRGSDIRYLARIGRGKKHPSQISPKETPSLTIQGGSLTVSKGYMGDIEVEG